MLTNRNPALPIATLSALLLTGCPSNPSGSPDAGTATKPAVDAQAPSPEGQRGPLGGTCSSNADCTSGFCTDGVCCDSACEQTCYACDQQAALGHCAALTSGEDPSATAACTAPSACFLPTSSDVPACKLVDGTACQEDRDCVSGHCLTYYVDGDGDSYGSSEQALFCAELNGAPPTGYAAYSGDCCDIDAGANPGFDSSQFLTFPDACGSFDWNCNGVLTEQRSCPRNANIQCGQGCTFPVLGLTGITQATLFTEACN